jgi:alkylation response protein AidB-like acyl-CoA dehydrogenase
LNGTDPSALAGPDAIVVLAVLQPASAHSVTAVPKHASEAEKRERRLGLIGMEKSSSDSLGFRFT